jgi:hypothetical protein
LKSTTVQPTKSDVFSRKARSTIPSTRLPCSILSCTGTSRRSSPLAAAAAAAEEVEQFVRRSVDNGEAFVRSAATWTDSLAKLAPFVPEAQALLHLLRVCTTEALPTSDKVAQLARAHRDAVLRGDAAATLPQPPEAYVAPPVPAKEPTVTVFAMTQIKFKNASGEQIVVQAYQDAEMPPPSAAKALRLGVVTKLDDPRRSQHHGTVGGHPRADQALNIDAAPEPVREAVLHSAFEKPTIGPAQILKIATRSLT